MKKTLVIILFLNILAACCGCVVPAGYSTYYDYPYWYEPYYPYGYYYPYDYYYPFGAYFEYQLSGGHRGGDRWHGQNRRKGRDGRSRHEQSDGREERHDGRRGR